VITFARIEGGPLHAKHQAAVVIHPSHRVNIILSVDTETYLAIAPKIVEQRVQNWLTIDIVPRQSGHLSYVRLL
jgi:hypothetical protein